MQGKNEIKGLLEKIKKDAQALHEKARKNKNFFDKIWKRRND